MNKKKLSVVMAGAMLASSVAPVLAADVTSNEVNQGKLGLLINDLEAFMETKKFHATDVNEAGKSVYRFQIFEETNKEVEIGGVTSKIYTINGKSVRLYDNAEVLKRLDFTSNKFYTIKVYELGSAERNNGYFSTDKAEGTKVNYDATTFANLVSDVKAFEANKGQSDYIYKGLYTAVSNQWVTNLELNKEETKVTVTLGSKDSNGNYNKLECAVGTPKYSFADPIDKDGNEIKTLGNDIIQGSIAGFKVAEKVASTDPEVITGKKATLLHEVKVVNGDVNYTVKVSDLYDGFMLTEKGHELMNAIKSFENDDNSKTTQVVGERKSGKGTERYFTVTLTDANGTKNVVKVVGDSLNLSKIDTLNTWYKNRVADVELLAGDNRYATAVEIAETYLAGQYDKDGSLKPNYELVLINGEALVDGLAAAPYAREKEAPILLTAKDKLPKETKDYLKKLVSKHSVGGLKNLTITIVGGDAVVSESVTSELEDLGFKVKRISGDNREETSLAVADKLSSKAKAFVVGANGEADAMSIAAEAANVGAPIIVSKSVKGLSTIGVNEVSDYTDVEIVGGEGVVPKSTEEAIAKLVDKEHVTRINGKNRFETNALIIKKYHKNFGNALIAKDGQRNKSELVDALPASLFASSTAANGKVAAPIVLATDKISREQLNQLVLNVDKSKSNRTVYQIGNGVSRSVMETVVTKLGLNR